MYYKRYQPPSSKAERSHQRLDIPRRKVARWYGPARIPAVETKVSYDGHARQPSSNAWIIASGRLKKVSTTQLRHAGPRERVVAEGTSQLTAPWTFQDLSQFINKGEYDDEVMTERQLEADTRRVRTQWDEELRTERFGIKRQLQPDGLGLPGQTASSQDATRQRMTSPTREKGTKRSLMTRTQRLRTQREIHVSKFLPIGMLMGSFMGEITFLAEPTRIVHSSNILNFFKLDDAMRWRKDSIMFNDKNSFVAELTTARSLRMRRTLTTSWTPSTLMSMPSRSPFQLRAQRGVMAEVVRGAEETMGEAKQVEINQ